jgi:prepilin-type N-terminal cleavage/methylation domain-containing protein
MSKSRVRTRSEHASGFTLIELIVVVGLIAIMAAVGLPNMLAYLRNYAIEGAAKDVASEIQAARYKAISRNVNLGVLLHLPNVDSYQWIMEDDANPQSPDPNDNWANHGDKTLPQLLGYDDQHGPLRRLPTGVQFDPTGATDPALRYNRFGGWCQPASDLECPSVAGFSGTAYVQNQAAGASIRLVQPSTGLRRTIRVGSGGRVIIEPN